MARPTRPGRGRSARAARSASLLAVGDQRVHEASLLAKPHHVTGLAQHPGARARLLAVGAAESDVGVGGADRPVERAHRFRLAADVDRPLHLQRPSAAGAGPADQLERDVGLPVAERGRRARRGRCSRPARPCPRGPGPWPGRAWRGEARTARTRRVRRRRARQAISSSASTAMARAPTRESDSARSRSAKSSRDALVDTAPVARAPRDTAYAAWCCLAAVADAPAVRRVTVREGTW